MTTVYIAFPFRTVHSTMEKAKESVEKKHVDSFYGYDQAIVWEMSPSGNIAFGGISGDRHRYSIEAAVIDAD